ncbi:MAG: hypothetical protein K1060chlam2_00562 [Chlamydiae bacterium]|nr:hypothetical protein [Chlamydiota bacterium]
MARIENRILHHVAQPALFLGCALLLNLPGTTRGSRLFSAVIGSSFASLSQTLPDNKKSAFYRFRRVTVALALSTLFIPYATELLKGRVQSITMLTSLRTGLIQTTIATALAGVSSYFTRHHYKTYKSDPVAWEALQNEDLKKHTDLRTEFYYADLPTFGPSPDNSVNPPDDELEDMPLLEADDGDVEVSKYLHWTKPPIILFALALLAGRVEFLTKHFGTFSQGGLLLAAGCASVGTILSDKFTKSDKHALVTRSAAIAIGVLVAYLFAKGLKGRVTLSFRSAMKFAHFAALLVALSYHKPPTLRIGLAAATLDGGMILHSSHPHYS